MKPIRTPKTTGIYGAPRGLEREVGGLPYFRKATGGGIPGTTVYSVWTFTPQEREYIARGANLVLGIVGMEPIPPVSLDIRGGPDDEWFNETPDPPEASDAERPRPPIDDRQVGGRSKGEHVEPKEAPDQTVTASDRAREVVAAFEILTAKDATPDNAKHLWSLAHGMVADIHRGRDNYPEAPAKP